MMNWPPRTPTHALHSCMRYIACYEREMAVGRSLPSLGRYRGLFPPRSAPTTRAYCTLCGFTGGVVLLTAGSVFCSVIARHPQSGGHPMHTPPLPLALITIMAGLVMVAASLLSIYRYGLDDGDDAVEEEAQFVVGSDTLDQLYQQQPMQQQQMLYHRLIETQLQRERASVETTNQQQQQQSGTCCYNGTHGTITNHNQQTNGCSCGASGSHTRDVISHCAPEAECLKSRGPDCNYGSDESQAQKVPGLSDRGYLPSKEGTLSGGPSRGTPIAVTASGTLVPSRLHPSTSCGDCRTPISLPHPSSACGDCRTPISLPHPSSACGDCRTPQSHPQKMDSIIVANKDAIRVILGNS